MKCCWDEKFASLLTKVGGTDVEERTLASIVISRSEKFIDATHIVPPDAPIVLYVSNSTATMCV